LDRPAQAVCQEHVVSVQDEHQLTPGEVESQVAGRRQPAVHRMSQQKQRQGLVMSTPADDRLARTIRRPVVDDDALYVRVSVVQGRLQGLGYQCRVVVEGRSARYSRTTC